MAHLYMLAPSAGLILVENLVRESQEARFSLASQACCRYRVQGLLQYLDILIIQYTMYTIS